MSGAVLFTTPGIDRVFISCKECQRVMPHYRVYGAKPKRPTDGMCKCGSTYFRPRNLPTWRAAWWLLVVGWLWRKTIRKEHEWDPRMPIRQQG